MRKFDSEFSYTVQLPRGNLLNPCSPYWRGKQMSFTNI